MDVKGREGEPREGETDGMSEVIETLEPVQGWNDLRAIHPSHAIFPVIRELWWLKVIGQGHHLMHNKTNRRAWEQRVRSQARTQTWIVKKDGPPSETLAWLPVQYLSFGEPIGFWKASRFIIVWCHGAPHHWGLWLVKEQSCLLKQADETMGLAVGSW